MKPTKILTDNEARIMALLWEHGTLFLRDFLDYSPEPKPHVNTLSTTLRALEEKGHVGHTTIGNANRYYATSLRKEFSSRHVDKVIRNFYGNSAISLVKELVTDKKITLDELKALIRRIEVVQAAKSQS